MSDPTTPGTATGLPEGYHRPVVDEGDEVGVAGWRRALQRIQYFFLTLFAPGEGTWVLVGSVVVLSVILGFFLVASQVDADTWVPMLILVNLVVISVPICMRLSGMPRDSKLFKLLLASFFLKMLFTPARYWLNEGYYKGEGDAARYDQAGDYFIENFKQGKWDIAPAELNSFPKETRVVGYITGMLYIPFGTTYFGGYLIFSWLAWLGYLCVFKAFRVAYPNAPPYFLAKLMLFFPSLLFWPASIGKDALMVLLIGVFTIGVARVLTGDRLFLGILWVVTGATLMLQVRPHLLLVSAVALALSTMAQPAGRPGRRGIILRIVVLLLVVPFLATGVSRMDRVFGTSSGEDVSLDASLNETVDRTQIGGSAFETQPVRTPLDVPVAMITVLFRPFLFEARSVPVLISALEGTVLMALAVGAARWIWRMGTAMYRSSFAAYCGFYVIAFVIAFSNIGNAGILSRQRVQMFPLLLTLAAIAHEQHRLHQIAVAQQLEPHQSTWVGDDPVERPSLPAPAPA